jgi:glycosyltransferase involved in cell wall biosynthesis
MSRQLTVADLPPPPLGKTGWPWTVASPAIDQAALAGRAVPSFLIVMPSYNQGQFIEEGIRSVLLQRVPNLQFVVIDGGSTDGTVGILQKYAPWLTAWVSEKDRGQTHAINKGFAGRTADICAYLNSDDYYLQGALAKVAESTVRYEWDVFMGRHEQPPMAFSQRIRRSNWRRQALPILAPFLIDFPTYDVHQESTFWKGSPTAGWQFDDELHFIMDADWFCRICRGARIVIATDRIGHVREHPARKTAMYPGRQEAELSRVKHRWPLTADERAAAAAILARFERERPRLVRDYLLWGHAAFAYTHPMSAEAAIAHSGAA